MVHTYKSVCLLVFIGDFLGFEVVSFGLPFEAPSYQPCITYYCREYVFSGYSYLEAPSLFAY